MVMVIISTNNIPIFDEKLMAVAKAVDENQIWLGAHIVFRVRVFVYVSLRELNQHVSKCRSIQDFSLERDNAFLIKKKNIIFYST